MSTLNRLNMSCAFFIRYVSKQLELQVDFPDLVLRQNLQIACFRDNAEKIIPVDDYMVTCRQFELRKAAAFAEHYY